MDEIVVQYGRTTTMPVGGLVDADAPENLQANPTLAAGDVQISKDGGAFANVTNLPTPIGTTAALEWTPATGELDCSYAYLLFIDQTTTKEWGDKLLLVLTKDNASGFYGQDVDVDVNGHVTVASDGLDQVVVAEPSAVPAWGTATAKEALSWLVMFFRNKMTQTATTQTVRNDADSADITTSTVSDDGTTATRGEYS